MPVSVSLLLHGQDYAIKFSRPFKETRRKFEEKYIKTVYVFVT